MDVASLVLGIIGVVFAFIPFCNFLSSIICGIGFILGIVILVINIRAGKPKGMSIAGVILNGIGLFLWLWPIVLIATM